MATRKWAIDPTHSEIQFKVRHLMISTVTGSFTDYNVQAESEEYDMMNAKVVFTAKLDSISTGNADRDAHLKSPDFFDASNHPEIKFVSTSVKPGDSKEAFRLTGDLTVRGITKPITLDVEFGGIAKDPWGNTRAGFTVTGKLNRKDYGLTWNAMTEAGGVVVSDEVKIQCGVELVESK
jgi:polyisoprenoid-binding protein YceI